MEDEKKTKKQLIEELNELRKCVAELKGFETVSARYAQIFCIRNIINNKSNSLFLLVINNFRTLSGCHFVDNKNAPLFPVVNKLTFA
jgi:hypothetical protein